MPIDSIVPEVQKSGSEPRASRPDTAIQTVENTAACDGLLERLRRRADDPDLALLSAQPEMPPLTTAEEAAWRRTAAVWNERRAEILAVSNLPAEQRRFWLTVPPELRSLRRWIGWRKCFKESTKKPTKVPHSPVDGRTIGATEKYREYFVTLVEALTGAQKHDLTGVGFVFLKEDGYVGVDFDNCVTDGVIRPEVMTYLHWLPSYAETSPSGRGVHVLARGTLARAVTATALPGADGVTVEMYSTDRYFTVTTSMVGTTIRTRDCQVGINKLLQVLGKEKSTTEGKKFTLMTLDGKKLTPMTVEEARRLDASNLAKLRGAKEGEGNALLNAAAWFRAKAFAAGVFSETEERLRDEPLRIVTHEWKNPYPEQEARAVVESSWRSGKVEPLFILDREREEKEALAYVQGVLTSKDDLTQEQEKELIRQTLKLSTLARGQLRGPVAKRLKIGRRDLNNLLKEQHPGMKKDDDGAPPQGAIVYSLENYDQCLREAEKALASIEGRYFECDRRLVMPVHARDVKEIKNVGHDDASVLIEPVSEETARRDLIRHAKFVGQRDDGFGEIFPPRDIVKDIFDRLRAETREVPYTHLDALVATPTLLPSGAVHDVPGQIREGVLYLNPSRGYPRIEVHPSREDAIQALEKFKPVFEKFPFTGQDKRTPWYKTPSYSVVLAGCLTLAARPALRSAVPLIVSSGPKQRSGKTLIVEANSMAMLGHLQTVLHYTDEEELGKTLLPVIQSQTRAAVIDNVERWLRSAKLSLLITGNRLSDRILRESRTAELVNRTVFFATGNNIGLAGDLAYRAIQSRIDPDMERPEMRSFDFHPRERAGELHPELLHAALVALRAFVAAGKPWNLDRSPWGGFEPWDRLISGCLVWLGYSDPFLTRDQVIGDDPEREGNLNILEAWYAEFESRPVRVSEIEQRKTSEIYRQLLDREGRWQPQTAAHKLHRLRDRVEGGLKLIRVPTSSKSSQKREWQVICVEPQEHPRKDEDEESLF